MTTIAHTTPRLIPAPSPWQPRTLDDPPVPPPPDTREEQLAQLAAQEKLGHDGKRQRVRARRTVDPFGGLERWKIFKSTRASIKDEMFIRNQHSFVIDLLPPHAYTNFSTSFCNRYAHTSTNKIRCPVNIATFTPDARRILTGSTSGEFTLWNGLTFNFETILQAHDSAVRALAWSNSGQWLLSTDNSGLIKYFQPNMNNLQIFQGHNEAIRDVSWAPNDERFCTGGDDGVLKIWNFERMKEEKVLTGHGWDVKCVKWHPTKGLLASGSKDNLVKFWDPRTSTVLTTLHGHKNTIQALQWSPNGHMVATASRDQLIKVFDIRAMKELVTLRGHKKEVCSLAWHPIHSDILTSGGSEGSIIHWSLPDPSPKETLEFAHDSNVWSLAYHPLGHLLVSASNDHTTRFWSRGRPGVRVKGDRFHVGKERAKELGEEGENPAMEDDRDDFALPGLQHQQNGRGGGPPRNNFVGALPSFGNQNRSNYNNQDSSNRGPPPSSSMMPLPGFGNGSVPPPPPPPGLGGSNEGFIPGFGGGGSNRFAGPPQGMMDDQAQFGGSRGSGAPSGYGMGRRGAPLPSQSESLERVAGPGAANPRRWGNGGNGGRGGGGGGGGGGLPY
ncbi:WD40 repeat domain-containing protein [Sporobolomyces salmoneus]|uniref:WD40 repeat domain-containing protein n=1 Tax=Sporobolomyces salmoneus TaxID=183962 RepID=UPI003175A16C